MNSTDRAGNAWIGASLLRKAGASFCGDAGTKNHSIFVLFFPKIIGWFFVFTKNTLDLNDILRYNLICETLCFAGSAGGITEIMGYCVCAFCAEKTAETRAKATFNVMKGTI